MDTVDEAEVYAEERIELAVDLREVLHQNRVHIESVVGVAVGQREDRPAADRLAGRLRLDQLHVVGGCCGTVKPNI